MLSKEPPTLPDCLNTPTTLPHETTFQRINRLADLQKKTHYARLRRLVDQHAKRHPDVLAGEHYHVALLPDWWADWDIWNMPGECDSRLEAEVLRSIASQCPNRPQAKSVPLYISVEPRRPAPRSWRHSATLKELRLHEKGKILKLAAEHELPDWDEWMAPYAKY